MDKQSVPKLDLSFSCDSVRSPRKPEVQPLEVSKLKKDWNTYGSSNGPTQTPRLVVPPYAVDLETPTVAASSSRKPQNDTQSGFFTPYNENRTARRLLERELTDLNFSRKIIESRLPEENGAARSTKSAFTTRPSSALASGESAKRVAFGARLLVNSDCDSLRDFTGFFWPEDSTLAIYEFRGMTKASGRVPPRVLPFVSRGRYNHAGGIKKGQSVTLCDLTEGKDVVLSVSENSPALNDTLRQRSIFVLRVTHVDLAEKRSILLKDVRISEHDKVLKELHAPQTNEEMEFRTLLSNIRSVVRKILRNRGIPTLLNMRHELGISTKLPNEQLIDENTSKKYNLTREQITTLLARFSINLNSADVDRLCSYLDTDQNGSVDFNEFVRGICGGLSESRHLFVRRAWLKMDPSKTGRLTVSTVRKFYSARTHPDVVSGERSELAIIGAFTSMLQPKSRFSAKGDDGEAVIGFGEFEAYYEGLNLAIDSDEDFVQILKDTWGNLTG